ncbi:hypothetical protein ACEN9D_05245 [Pseudomonas sp. CT11-2]|uniref:hypothetical protein n=1 Tax=Pseudomonas sp. CT11-2 TaxID=3243023 RepID=UPI0039B0F796
MKNNNKILKDGTATLLAVPFLSSNTSGIKLAINNDISDTAPKAALEIFIKGYEPENLKINAKFYLFAPEDYKTSNYNFLTVDALDLETWHFGNRENHSTAATM